MDLMDFDLSESKHLILWHGIVPFKILTSTKLYGTLIARVEIWGFDTKRNAQPVGEFWVGSKIVWIMFSLKDKLSFWIKTMLSRTEQNTSQNRSQGAKAGAAYHCPRIEIQLHLDSSDGEGEMGGTGFHISVKRI